MTSVLTRAGQIANIEGFEIIVTRDGEPVDPKANGIMGKYPYMTKLRGSKTVNEWRRNRFERSYPGLSCDVLKEDGTTAAAQTTLTTVRATYEEEDDE